MDTKPLISKGLAVGMILLFLGTSVIPAMGQNTEETASVSRGGWLYVGGNGPGNYTRIQDAVDNASDGDTVFVFNGSYYENIKITKSITVSGENADTTHIIHNTSESPYGIHIYSLSNPPSASVIIEGLTIFIQNASVGIRVSETRHCEIRNNNVIASENTFAIGIEIRYSDYITVMNNSIENLIGIDTEHCSNINISRNTLVAGPLALDMYNCNDCIVTYNTFKKTTTGISLWSVELSLIDNCMFSYNNFLNRHSQVHVYHNEISAKNTWYRNYWGRLRLLPKPIYGHVIFGADPFPTYLPWFYFDFFPAKKLNDIQGLI